MKAPPIPAADDSREEYVQRTLWCEVDAAWTNGPDIAMVPRGCEAASARHGRQCATAAFQPVEMVRTKAGAG